MNKINFTREMIHDCFCNLPHNEKLKYAQLCAQNNIAPQDIEQTIYSIAKTVEPFANYVAKSIKYWTKENNNV